MTTLVFCGSCRIDHETGCPKCARCRKAGRHCGMVHLDRGVLRELDRRTPLVQKLYGKFGAAVMSREEPEPLYRYTLEPEAWSEGWLMVGVLHNPSVANHEDPDPTATRMIGFAKREGAGRLIMVNVCAWRATDPTDLRKAEDPVGPENLRIVLEMAKEAKVVVAAWGALHKEIRRKTWAIRRALVSARPDLLCVGTTAKGDPRHPLYLSGNAPLVSWKGVS